VLENLSKGRISCCNNLEIAWFECSASN